MIRFIRFCIVGLLFFVSHCRAMDEKISSEKKQEKEKKFTLSLESDEIAELLNTSIVKGNNRRVRKYTRKLYKDGGHTAELRNAFNLAAENKKVTAGAILMKYIDFDASDLTVNEYRFMEKIGIEQVKRTEQIEKIVASKMVDTSEIVMDFLTMPKAATGTGRLYRPMLQALKDKDAKTVQSLAARGCDLDAKTKDGKTYLQVATEVGDVDSVRALIAHGAVLTKDIRKQLITSAKEKQQAFSEQKRLSENYDDVSKFIENLPIANTIEDFNTIPTDYKNKFTLLGLLNLMRDGTIIDSNGNSYCSHKKEWNRLEQMAQFKGLQKRGLNLKNVKFRHPNEGLLPFLYTSFDSKNICLAYEALKAGADPLYDQDRKDSCSPFMYQIAYGLPETVQLFMEQGIKPNEQCNGRFPLETAIIRNNVKTGEILLKNGSRVVNYSDDIYAEVNHMIPLITAIESGTPEMVQLLLKYGANPMYQSRFIENHPLCEAVYKKKTEIYKLLSDNCEQCVYANIILKNGTHEMLEYALQNGQDPDKGWDGQDLLDYAIQNNKEKEVELLLQYKATIRDYHMKRAFGKQNIEDLLLRYGADKTRFAELKKEEEKKKKEAEEKQKRADEEKKRQEEGCQCIIM